MMWRVIRYRLWVMWAFLSVIVWSAVCILIMVLDVKFGMRVMRKKLTRQIDKLK